jgi:hypothetical protein
VKYIVTEPVVITTDTTEDTTTSTVIETTGTIPVQVTLTTNNAETATKNVDGNAEISVVIPPATEVKNNDGSTYTGIINPPQVVKPDTEAHGDIPETAIVLEMGNPDQKINFSQPFVTTVRIEAEVRPDIYYLDKDTGKYTLAGITGTKDGVDYVPGGKLLATEEINGTSVFTIGLLMDHMSTYVASSSDPNPAAAPPVAPAAPGGGSYEPARIPSPGSTDISSSVASDGRFLYDVSVVAEDGRIALMIPADTVGLGSDLKRLTEIIINTVENIPSLPEGDAPVGPAYDIGPDGAVFEPGIQLTWYYSEDDLPQGFSENNLAIAWYDEATGEWLYFESEVHPDGNYVTGPVTHFSLYALVAISPEEQQVAAGTGEQEEETAGTAEESTAEEESAPLTG